MRETHEQRLTRWAKEDARQETLALIVFGGITFMFGFVVGWAIAKHMGGG